MEYEYLNYERKQETAKAIRSFIPRPLLLLRKRMQNKKRFPKAFLDMESTAEPRVQIGDNAVIRKHCMLCEDTSIGRFTTVGPNCTMNGRAPINIGSFCSIGPECLFWSENHITENRSTYPFEQILRGTDNEYEEYGGEEINIGHDVWIGQRAMILAGANIGDGCVIAAGSVVPRGTYEPYSIIGGVPGKVIKKRLPDDEIKDLLELKWWDKSEKEIFTTYMDYLHQGMKP